MKDGRRGGRGEVGRMGGTGQARKNEFEGRRGGGREKEGEGGR